MKLIRMIVFTVSLVLLGVGYAASQISYRDGSYQEYAARVDSPPVRLAALGLLGCCVFLPFLGKRSGAADK
ncbi:MAG TPA: hypothetical protein VKT78_03825 [Fimbriimonadaceae bacterium]|nr:hypothetical protein [Fimbriimonadaceae bacterium]